MSLFFQTVCSDITATVKLAKMVASCAQKGDTFALFGTLGVGKSVFARAFIQELTHVSEVPSPTFTLVQIYPVANFDIYHFDLYRLKSEEEIWELNMEEALFEGVALIEWPEKMNGYLPRNIIKVYINSLPNGDRTFAFETTDESKKERFEKTLTKQEN